MIIFLLIPFCRHQTPNVVSHLNDITVPLILNLMDLARVFLPPSGLLAGISGYKIKREMNKERIASDGECFYLDG